MNEAARAQYLDAMGIQQFVPRYALPHAPASVLCEPSIEWLDDELIGSAHFETHNNFNTHSHSQNGCSASQDERNVQSANSTQINDQTTAQSTASFDGNAAGMQAFLNSEPVAEPLRKVDTDLTLQQWVAKKPHKTLRFHLLVWVLDNGVMLVDTHLPKAALPTPALLKNILYSLDRNLVIPTPDVIRWPVLESPILNPQEESEAASMVQAFVLSRLESMGKAEASKAKTPKAKTPKAIVAMGEVAARMLTCHMLQTSESDSSGSGQVRTHTPPVGESIISSQYGCPVVILPSLADMLKQPLLKQAVWPAVKPYF